jgi:CO/xanthine dehydrogenase Mo-binding subunit
MTTEEFRVIGKRVAGVDLREKATGETRYLMDLKWPGMLVGRVLRSPHPHARVLRIDTGRAKAAPGVRAVVTAEDTPNIPYGIVIPDELPLARDKVRYIGDEVAAVAAADEEAAEEALRLIDVEYEVLPAVFDPVEAMQPGAPRIHEVERNIAYAIHLERGDGAAALAAAEVVLEEAYATPMMHQGNLEPICCAAEYTGGRLTVWAPFQSPFLARQFLLAKPLNLPYSAVRCIQTPVGGAFGGKLDQRLYLVCGLLAMHAGKPVRMANSYAEELTATRPRLPTRIGLRSGWAKDGRLLAKQVEIVADNGAYSSLSPPIMSSMSMRTDNCYRTPAVKIDADCVYTNTQPTGQMRGFGNPQATFAWESHLDMAAERLGIDPAELRLRNATQTGDVTVHGWRIASCGLSEAIRRAAERIGWREQRARRPPNRGVGLACTIHVTSNKPFATSITGYDYDGSAAYVRVHEDGAVSVATGEVDLGEGVNTTLALIAAEELGVPVDQVSVNLVDTDAAPYGLGTYASRTTFMGGNAVRAAAADARGQLFQVAAALLGADPADLEARDGKVTARSSGRAASIGEVVRAAFNQGTTSILGRGTYTSEPGPMDAKRRYGNQTMTYSFACHAAEVEVDPGTGRVRVLRVVAAHDLGRVINRLGAEGQVEGGVTQGLGFALSEELRFEEGRILNAGFLDYKIPSSLDAPVIEPIFVETDDPYGPYGAKGMAETAINPTAAAIANAIYHATGARLRALPMTPEKVRAAIRALEHRR